MAEAVVVRNGTPNPDAVKNHPRTLFAKLEISHRKRARLVECAFQWGLASERERVASEREL